MGRRHQEPFDTSTLPPPWDRILPLAVRATVWLMLFLVLWMLRSFSLLIFLTFVFAYIQSHVVDKFKGVIRSRPVRVVLVGTLGLLLIIGVFGFLIPRFKDQAEIFTSRYTDYLHIIDSHMVQLSVEYPALERFLPDVQALPRTFDETGRLTPWTPTSSVTGQSISQWLGVNDEASGAQTKELLKSARLITAAILATGSAFLLSLLFSFLIVLDLPNLTRSVTSLERSRVGFIYQEVAENIRKFAGVLGAALEAQLFIALLNTILTAICLYFLGLGDKVVFLSLIVFICSFIPVAGVFISSPPICLLALQEGGGFLLLMAALMIWLIHMIEAYVLNPRIYGHRLRVNPVLVLIVLTIGGKLFGVWGLILGLPVCTYIFQHAIRYEKDRIPA